MTNQIGGTGTGAGANRPDAGAGFSLPAEVDDEDFWFRSSSDVRDGYVRGIKAFDVRPVTYAVIDEVAIFEGDIALGSAQSMDAIRSEVEAERARAGDEPSAAGPKPEGSAITGTRFRWPGGIIAWVSEPALRDIVLRAIEHWKAHTTLTFVELTPSNRGGHNNWVSFEMQRGCWSHVGMQGGRQLISLGIGCGFGQAVHEIGHAVGLWHEQSREDRDANVRIEWANIQGGHEHNFNQHIVDGDDVGSYDAASIMHYGPTAFSSNGKPTITSLHGQPIGQRGALSDGDIAAVRALYP